jgi:[acyl-carrier-protein] S-malonyltransferase
MIALLFPGQGAQEVGMGEELASAFPLAEQTFAEADDVLGYSLSEVCFQGPVERLTETDVCQPALVTTSIAAWRVAAEHGLRADVVLGHSLGEYSALVAAGSMPFETALRIVAERGAAMHEAAQARPGAMAALLGMSDADAAALCDEAGDCWPANYNCPGQVVASGTREGIDQLLALIAERGGKATRLAVGGAFHSPLMEPAAERLRPALEAWEPQEPKIPFLSTTTAKLEDAAALRGNLLDQLTSPVRFGDAGQAAAEMGVTGAVEVGPGRVLSGLMKRINRRIPSRQVGAPSDLLGLESFSCR